MRMRRKTKHTRAVMKPTARIGKKGPTDFLINEISRHLDKRKTVKVKILKTALVTGEAEEIASEVAEKTKSRILELRGHTFILRKSKKS